MPLTITMDEVELITDAMIGLLKIEPNDFDNPLTVPAIRALNAKLTAFLKTAPACTVLIASTTSETPDEPYVNAWLTLEAVQADQYFTGLQYKLAMLDPAEVRTFVTSTLEDHGALELWLQQEDREQLDAWTTAVAAGDAYDAG